MLPKQGWKFECWEKKYRSKARGGPFTCEGVTSVHVLAVDVHGFERQFQREDWLFARLVPAAAVAAGV